MKKKKESKSKNYCQPCHTSVLMRVLCSVLLRGVGHIRQLYPWDNWPDRDAKQVRRHFEERARSQVRDTTNQISFPDLISSPDEIPYTKGYVISTTPPPHSIYLLRLCYTFSDTRTRAHTWYSDFFPDFPTPVPLPWMQSPDRAYVWTYRSSSRKSRFRWISFL